MPRVDNPIIGRCDCPTCGASNEVKRNKGGTGAAYFYCPCGYHGRWNYAQTREIFLTKKPDFSEPKHEQQNEYSDVSTTASDATKAERSERAEPEQRKPEQPAKRERITTAFD